MLITSFLNDYSAGEKVTLIIFFSAIVYMFFHFAFKMLEMAYVLRVKKPFYTHFYLKKKTLNQLQKNILKQDFSFYNKLTPKYQSYFEHRVACFMIDKDFVGRGGVKINQEMRVLTSATAVMLTFGFRDFYIGLISKIVIYPKAFYSKTNNTYHKGEFNPKLKALVLSWDDFEKGFDINNDNLNLGIHEFAHAIHLNSIKERDVSSIIFKDSFKELTSILQNEEHLRAKLVESEYFRKYAFTNQFEFLAVILETFIETPGEFKTNFPIVYHKTKQMLNFNFANY